MLKNPNPDKYEQIDKNKFSYVTKNKKILIIKLGAIGDVIRTTPLIEGLRKKNPGCEIWWVTDNPQVLPEDIKVYQFNWKIIEVFSTQFDIIINLDKDYEACWLASALHANTRKGFMLDESRKCIPVDDLAVHKFLTGLDDPLSKKNHKSYVQEAFEISGLEWQGEEYSLCSFNKFSSIHPTNSLVIGMNTGCGPKWPHRTWPEEHWINLAKKLKLDGHVVVLLGGPDEDEKNQKIAREAKVNYFGHFDFKSFLGIMNTCDIVITSVTMGLHCAIGLKKQVILFNNCFNNAEFELYNRGIIINPPGCKCWYSYHCRNACMSHIDPDRVYQNVKNLIQAKWLTY